MVTIVVLGETYLLKEQDMNTSTVSTFNNGRVLNAGNKVTKRLRRPSCATTWWPTFLSILVGRVITLDGEQVAVSDESSSTEDDLTLVYFPIAHDTRGEI